MQPQSQSLLPPPQESNTPQSQSQKTKEQFMCNKCRLTFADKQSHKRHRITNKQCIPYFITCKRCLKQFDDIVSFMNHQRNDKCELYKFENKVEQHNRILTDFNIKDLGFKTYIRKVLTPVATTTITPDGTEVCDTKQNIKLAHLVYNCLTNDEFIEVMTCPGLFYCPCNKGPA